MGALRSTAHPKRRRSSTELEPDRQVLDPADEARAQARPWTRFLHAIGALEEPSEEDAHLEAREQYYLTPLALVGETAALLPQWIEAGVAQGDQLTQVLSDDEKQVLAQGYEVSRRCVWEGLTWQERVLVVRSHAYAQTQRRHLEDRLDQAQAALLALTPPVGRGKRQIIEEAALQSAAEAVLTR